METERLFESNGLRFGYYDELFLSAFRYDDKGEHLSATGYADPTIKFFFAFLLVFIGRKKWTMGMSRWIMQLHSNTMILLLFKIYLECQVVM